MRMSVVLLTCLVSLPLHAEQITGDLLIVGGTESGCAAAVQAARMKVKSIVLVNDIEWLGGQFSAEALVAIDENRGPQGYDQTVPFPRNGLFKEVIDRIQNDNVKKYGVGRPGNTRVITTCRPVDAERVFRELLQPYVDSGQVRIVSNYFPVSAKVENKTKLKSVTFQSTEKSSPSLTVTAKQTIDATDWGDVIKVAGAAYEFGPDLKSKYGEPLAPESREGYPLTDMNPITYCMIVNETDQYKAIPKPAGYDPRNYENHPYPKDPLWLYGSRRVVDHYHFKQIKHPDVLLLCFPAFDYPLDVHPKRVSDALEATESGASKKNIVELSREQRQIVFDDAKQYSLGFLHYLQTVVHDRMEDKTHSFRRFVLSDEFGTLDKMPFKPYIRESLRLKAMYMMRQQDTMGYAEDARNFATVMYHDTIASWQFEYDFHPTGRKFLNKDTTAGPWQNYFRKGRTWGPPYSGLSVFPLRSLVPEKIDGLLGAQKNLGYSSIVSSAVRLHDQSMAIGQGCGAVAAVAIQNETQPRAIPYRSQLMSQVWSGLCSRTDNAIPQTLFPFRDMRPEFETFIAVNMLAVRNALPIDPMDQNFYGDAEATKKWRDEVVARSLKAKEFDNKPNPPKGKMSRGEFVKQWWKTIASLPDQPWTGEKLNDADADGVLDKDDPLPFHPKPSSWPEFVLPPDKDGIPEKLESLDGVRQFNFTGKGSKPVKSFVNDNGLVFDAKRGFGWSRDISANNRRRNRIEGEQRDTFLFTRTHDTWQCDLANGTYRVTVCVGDSDHEQFGQNVTAEGQAIFRDLTTKRRRFQEGTVKVEIKDKQLTIEIGTPGGSTNTCLNWVRIEPVQ